MRGSQSPATKPASHNDRGLPLITRQRCRATTFKLIRIYSWKLETDNEFLRSIRTRRDGKATQRRVSRTEREISQTKGSQTAQKVGAAMAPQRRAVDDARPDVPARTAISARRPSGPSKRKNSIPPHPVSQSIVAGPLRRRVWLSISQTRRFSSEEESVDGPGL